MTTTLNINSYIIAFFWATKSLESKIRGTYGLDQVIDWNQLNMMERERDIQTWHNQSKYCYFQ